MRTIFSFLIASLFVLSLQAQQSGYNIDVQISNFDQDSLYLGYYLGDKQYLRDTVTADDTGHFVFSGEEPLLPGMYLVVLPPDNNYFQLLVNEKEQHFGVQTNGENPVLEMQIEGSPDNALFYDYLNFLNENKPKANELNQQLEAAKAGSPERQQVEQELEKLNKSVADRQQKILQNHPNTLTAAIIRSNQQMDMPEFEGSEEEKQVKAWRYTQKHFFDNLDLSDERLLRTPFLFDRIDYYVHKLQVQHPDTISKAIDLVLDKAGPAEETFRFYLVHFLNEAARSNVVGMDAVYVHLVENYYKKGKATWTDEESMKKIVENSDALKPLLIGKTAPDITVQKRDGSQVSLHDIDSEYTILYFWRPDCSHCQKSTPDMKAFYDKYKDKGVTLMAVCVKYTDDVPSCWEYVDEKEINDWLHTADPYNRSKFGSVYNIKSTPQIYVLDKDKEILSKRIGAEQLEEVMDRIIEMNAAEKSGGKNSTP